MLVLVRHSCARRYNKSFLSKNQGTTYYWYMYDGGMSWDTVGYGGNSVLIPCDTVGGRRDTVRVYTVGCSGKSVGYRDIPWEVGGIP